jgi:hypothetical protein
MELDFFGHNPDTYLIGEAFLIHEAVVGASSGLLGFAVFLQNTAMIKLGESELFLMGGCMINWGMRETCTRCTS